MGLDISAKAMASQGQKTKSFLSTSANRVTVPTNEVIFQASNKTKWHPGEIRVGLQPELTFKSKNEKVKFGVGLEGGWRKSTSPDIEHNYTLHVESTQENGLQQDVTHQRNIKMDLNKSGVYITPTVSAEVKLGKKGNFSIVANRDMYQGQAGIRYTY